MCNNQILGALVQAIAFRVWGVDDDEGAVRTCIFYNALILGLGFREYLAYPTPQLHKKSRSEEVIVGLFMSPTSPLIGERDW